MVVTPDRHKQTQLCHVNMLKPYVERSTDLVLQRASVNAVVSEPKVELDSELTGNSFSPTDTTRLTNTDVLRNLDSKLSHLSESQRCWSLSTCFLMFPQGQIRFIMMLMLAMLIQLSNALTG